MDDVPNKLHAVSDNNKGIPVKSQHPSDLLTTSLRVSQRRIHINTHTTHTQQYYKETPQHTFLLASKKAGQKARNSSCLLRLSSSMEEQGGQREIQLQLLLLPSPAAAARAALRDVPTAPPASASDHPPLDLDLSMSIGPRLPPAPPPPLPPLANDSRRAPPGMMMPVGGRQQQQKQKHNQQQHQQAAAVKQQAAEQARMACAERAYAERVRELARRELELAEREFARARAIWERAREEVERVERMKQIAAARRLVVGTAAAEITCHACMQRFHP